jgi:hypothetical protein
LEIVLRGGEFLSELKDELLTFGAFILKRLDLGDGGGARDGRQSESKREIEAWTQTDLFAEFLTFSLNLFVLHRRDECGGVIFIATKLFVKSLFTFGELEFQEEFFCLSFPLCLVIFCFL